MRNHVTALLLICFVILSAGRVVRADIPPAGQTQVASAQMASGHVASGKKGGHYATPASREPNDVRSSRWIASMGLGLFFNPSVFLLNPQLEYVYRHNFYFGPMVQLGLGAGTLFTGDFTARYLFGHSRIRPAIEAGLGLAVSGGAAGLHIPIGLGMDYQLERGIAIGTMFRANIFVGNFGNSFSVSWPIIIGRFSI